MAASDDGSTAIPDEWTASLDVTGGCACGAVTFCVSGPMRPPVACHCEQCQRTTGHYLAATQVCDSDLTVTGAEHLTWYQSSGTAQRGFCSRCGSNLFWKPEGPPRTSIMMGAIDRPHPPQLRLSAHIYCADKASYYEIGEDGLPRHDQWS